MLELRNIEKKNNLIFADYYPEGSREKGTLVMDCETGRIVESAQTSFDEGLPMYLSHAAQSLRQIMHDVNLPKTRTAMWY